MLVLSGIAVLTFSYFQKDEVERKTTDETVPIWVYYFLVGSTPFLFAGCTIAMKNLTKFHNIVVSWYLSWSTVIVCWTGSVLTKENMKIFKHFSW